MKVHIRYFASLREALGASQMIDGLPDGMSLGALRDHLRASGQAHAQALDRTRAVRCALNQVMCEESAVLTDGAEVAFFPPVTGG